MLKAKFASDSGRRVSWREGRNRPKIHAYRLIAGWPESDYATAGQHGRLLIVVILCANNDVVGPRRKLERLPFRQRLLRKRIIAFIQ